MNETPTYTVFYENYEGYLIRVDGVIANDHEGALESTLQLADCRDVRLIFLGSIPEAIWHD